MKNLVRGALGVACLVGVLSGGYLLSLWPQGTGQVRLERLPGPAVVVRDGWGIPHIWASSPEAALFAMGYAHAQDRLWQMELLRRAAWGELSGIAGEPASPLDVLHRRLGFYRQALALRPSLAGEGELLAAYAHGITAYLRAHPTRLPPEFLVARLRPAFWKVEDVLAVGAMLEWLALPCSLRTRIWLEVSPGGGSLPPGLRHFVSPIQLSCTYDREVGEFVLSWGRQFPHPWVETGLMVDNGPFRRGWVIPGWPVPWIVTTREGVWGKPSPHADPWREESVEGWGVVLEFLTESPDGPCDTVWVNGPATAVSPSQRGRWWVTAGSPSFSVHSVAEGLGAWWGPLGSSTAPGCTASSPLSGHGRHVKLEPPIRFRLLDLLAGSRRTTLSFGIDGHAEPGQDVAPAVVVWWEKGSVRVGTSSGQSGVLGNPHFGVRRLRIPQDLVQRDLRVPSFSKGCALVPLGS